MLFKRLILGITSLLLIQCSDSTSSNNVENDFGIYLLKDSLLTTSFAKINKLESLGIQSAPIINLNDVISYDWSIHKMNLHSEAFDRFKTLDTKAISTDGLPFIIIVHGERIYLGNIYPCYSSLIHIDLPSINIAPFTEMRINRALGAYEDKRVDQRIYRVLQSNNKLKN